MVIQGAKSLQLGTDTINYGAGDYLLTSFDLPVAWRVVEASHEVPHFCISIAINSEKLLDVMSRAQIARPPTAVLSQRGIVVNAATPELLDATTRLLRLLDRPADIPAMAPLIEQEFSTAFSRACRWTVMSILAADSHGNRIARANRVAS